MDSSNVLSLMETSHITPAASSPVTWVLKKLDPKGLTVRPQESGLDLHRFVKVRELTRQSAIYCLKCRREISASKQLRSERTNNSTVQRLASLLLEKLFNK